MNTLFLFVAIGIAAVIALTYFYFTYRHQRTYYDDEIPRVQLTTA
tara:strand:+ start:5980 stop:6114 length:135 start_codon:yes stop_codon:yes gene_type:complete